MYSASFGSQGRSDHKQNNHGNLSDEHYVDGLTYLESANESGWSFGPNNQ